MRVPLSWLKKYVDIDLPSSEISDLLTMIGLEVDAVEKVTPSFEGVVIGEVLSAERHPDAERLKVAKVSDGTEEYQVVCGAPNCRSGIKVAFARVGAKLSDEEGKVFKIKKGKLRGVESFGMLCSGVELGVSDDADGILELGNDVVLGEEFGQDLSDEVFEISITPNLAYCMSIYGVARELAAITGAKLKSPQVSVKEEGEAIDAKVTVEDTTRCPRYACRLIKGVTLGPSPSWMQRHLELSGIRAINNIVDITNYVLLEMGHPLHAFDYDEVAGRQIIVRNAKEGEKFTTLDGIERPLKDENLLICDKDKAVALGGVMGGLNSEVTTKTKDILLEAAYFQPTNIRRTSRKLGLISESSQRFERGCDPNAIIAAIDRAAALMSEIGGGVVSKGIVDVQSQEFEPKEIDCRLSRINALLGVELAQGEVEKIFERLQFPASWKDDDTLYVKVPTYRVDIFEEVDLIEEVARMHGYDNIPRSAGKYQISRLPNAPIYTFEQKVRSRLVSEGLQEILTSDLVSPQMAELGLDETMPVDTLVKVMNPSSVEQSVLRPSLLPGILQVVKYNIDHGTKDLQAFEIGRIHYRKEESFVERSMAAIVFSGKRVPFSWDGEGADVDFFDIKGVVENLFTGLGLGRFSCKSSAISAFHTGRQAKIYLEGLELGAIGEVHPKLLRQLDVDQRLFFAVVDLHEMMKLENEEVLMTPISPFPGSARDWTMTVKRDISAETMVAAIEKARPKFLEEVQLRGIYCGEKVDAEHKNVTFRFFYRDRKKTIAQETVDKLHTRLVGQVSEALSIV